MEYIRTLLRFFGLLVVLLGAPHVHATTVYYQPTPYPTVKSDQTATPQALEIVHIWDGYVGSVYNTTFTRNDILQVGGWGDEYRSYLRFDVTGLPQTVSQVALRLWPLTPVGGATLTLMDVYLNTSSWDIAKMNWQMQPSANLLGTMPEPIIGQWWRMDVTTQYRGWKSGSNYGLRLKPQRTNNNFDTFHSSRDIIDAERPILEITFTPPIGNTPPTFKMPLPGGYRWLVTGEIGGYECMGLAPWPDPSHQGSNYFSIDFSSRSQAVGGIAPYPSESVPVLAAAPGVVKSVGSTQTTGYFITLSHGSGFLTRYIHFDTAAARKDGTPLVTGNAVNQGDQIGLMGNTGDSTGKHLHVNFWYNTDFNGGNAVAPLTYITMDGLPLKSYQTECATNVNGVPVDWVRYYESTNVPTGR